MEKTRVLLIDDDEAFLDTMHEILWIEDYELSAFTETVNIASLILQERPDILLFDYGLKTTTGGDLCRQVKNDPATENLPVILLSAFPEYALPLDKIPFTVFVPKPFDIWEFLRCLNTYRRQPLINSNTN